MIALRTPVSLRHLVVTGGQRKRCIGGDRRRGRVQRRHFTGALESLLRHSPHPHRSPAPAAAADVRSESNTSWQPPALENAAFEEYYKVRLLSLLSHILRGATVSYHFLVRFEVNRTVVRLD
jgi:hypothetical protein